MTRLEIDGASTLIADEDGSYVALTIDDGNEWQTIFLDYSEVFRLREWLSDWIMENQEVAE